VLIGGLAAVAHGSAIPTTDLDLVPDAGQDNLGRLAGALSDLEAKLRVPDLPYPVVVLDYRTFDAFTTAAFRTPYGDVDVVLRPNARGPRRHFTYDELNTRAQTRRAFGVTIRSPTSTTSSSPRPPPGGLRISPPFPIWPHFAPP